MRKPSLSVQKRYIEIIEDTVRFYKKHPRSVNDSGQCSYLDAHGNRCAVGRYISDEYIERLGDTNTTSVSGLINEWGELDSILVDSAIGLKEEFWTDLQGFHDSRASWNGMNLSKYGRDRLSGLRTKWAPDLITPKRNTRTKK